MEQEMRVLSRLARTWPRGGGATRALSCPSEPADVLVRRLSAEIVRIIPSPTHVEELGQRVRDERPERGVQPGTGGIDLCSRQVIHVRT
jgi:hypothetical protein